MSDGPKLLLIDGNNMCHRAFWANRAQKRTGIGLSYKGKCVDVLFGVFRQLIHLHKQYPDYFRIIAWDSGYARRLAESQEAVKNGIIPSEYKATRPKRGEPSKDGVDLEPLFDQMDELRDRGLHLVRGMQVKIDGVEADDILFTYAKTYEQWGGKSVIVSSDHDFFQALDSSISIYNPLKQEVLTAEQFEVEYGFHPRLWVDMGAIMGEIGPTKDNIFGIDGWGEVTACKYVREFGDTDAITAAIKAKPKIGKKEEVFLAQSVRLALAKSLKKMDIIPNVPKPRCPPLSEEELKKYWFEWSFASLIKEAWRLV